MNSSGRSQPSQQQIMETLTQHFPHLRSLMINPQASLSQNLENLVSHISQPDKVNLMQAINGMKDAVDKQQLKIQKSLVNAQNPLHNITNRQRPKHHTHTHQNVTGSSSAQIQPKNDENHHHQHNQEKKNIELEGILQESDSYEQYSNYEKSQHNHIDLIDEIWRLDEDDNGKQHHSSWFHHHH